MDYIHIECPICMQLIEGNHEIKMNEKRLALKAAYSSSTLGNAIAKILRRNQTRP